MKTIDNVIERYISSKNEDFTKDYEMVIKFINQQNLDDDEKLKLKMQCAYHFLGICHTKKMKVKDVCVTRDKRVVAEVKSLLDCWLATSDISYNEKAMGIIAYTEHAITFAFLLQSLSWAKAKMTDKQKDEIIKSKLISKEKDYTIGTSDAYKEVYTAIEQYDKILYSAEEWQQIGVGYQYIAKRLADELMENEELKTKEQKKRVYSLFQEHHRDRMRELFKQQDDYPTNPLYRDSLNDILNEFATKTIKCCNFDQLEKTLELYQTAVTQRYCLNLIDDGDYKRAIDSISKDFNSRFDSMSKALDFAISADSF